MEGGTDPFADMAAIISSDCVHSSWQETHTRTGSW